MRLLGAAEVIQEGLGIELQGFEQEIHAAAACVAEAALTHEEFKRLFELGRTMTSDEVIALIGLDENSVDPALPVTRPQRPNASTRRWSRYLWSSS